MVRIKDQDLDKCIKLTKFRIKHHEKHGCGINAMLDKKTLQRQEKKKESLK